MTKRDDASCVAAPVPPARERRGGTKPPKQTGSTRAAFGTLFEAVRSWEREGYCRTDVRGTFETLQFLILSLLARLGKLSLGDLRSPRPESHSCSIIRKGAKSNSWSWSWSAEKGDSVFGTSVVVAVSSHRTHRRPYDVRA